eukprot:GAHX01000628.1.p1 GENE.GAHX01000628.1~~GAHX01000628.1.p1  ORF type:complete len:365 (-),score=99.61 GAHX01000628.1:97-1191(-)
MTEATITLFVVIDDEIINLELKHSDSTSIIFETVSLQKGITPSEVSLTCSDKPISNNVTIQELLDSGLISSNSTLIASIGASETQATTTSNNIHQNLLDGLSANNIQDMMNNPGLISNLMSQPGVKDMFSNPKFIKDMMSKDSRFNKLLKDNPEISSMFNNKDVMKEVTEAVSDPKKLQELLKSSDKQMQNIMSMPGGHAQLRSVYNNIQKPLDGVMKGFGFGNNGEDENEIIEKEYIFDLNDKLKTECETKAEFKPSDEHINVKNPYANETKKNVREACEKVCEQMFGERFDVYGNKIRKGKSENWKELNEEMKKRYILAHGSKIDELKDLGFADDEDNMRLLYENNSNIETCVEELLSINGK